LTSPMLVWMNDRKSKLARRCNQRERERERDVAIVVMVTVDSDGDSMVVTSGSNSA